MVLDIETSIGVMFSDSLQLNHFLHRGRDENIDCKAILLNLSSPNVFISLKWKLLMLMFYTKNMVQNKALAGMFKPLLHQGKIGLLVDGSSVSSRLWTKVE